MFPSDSRLNIRAFLAGTLAVIFWGASFVATKVLLRDLTPATIVVARFGMGLALLLVVVRLRRESNPIRRRELPFLAFLGFIGIAFHQWLQANGLKTATATVTAWIIATIPVFIVILSWLILGEKLSKPQLGGIVLAAGGTVAVISGGNLSALVEGGVGTAGDILIIISAINWALFTVLSKRVIHSSEGSQTQDQIGGRNPIRVILVVMGFGWVFCLPWAIIDGGWQGLAVLDGRGWAALIFLGVACSGLAYLLWYYALDALSAAQTGVFHYIQPLVTTVLAGPMLGEAATATISLGGAVILLGVWWANRR
jgi:drug/metabolite transporter (DMT)-like permease